MALSERPDLGDGFGLPVLTAGRPRVNQEPRHQAYPGTPDCARHGRDRKKRCPRAATTDTKPIELPRLLAKIKELADRAGRERR
jgi:hypothetical protein